MIVRKQFFTSGPGSKSFPHILTSATLAPFDTSTSQTVKADGC